MKVYVVIQNEEYRSLEEIIGCFPDVETAIELAKKNSYGIMYATVWECEVGQEGAKQIEFKK